MWFDKNLFLFFSCLLFHSPLFFHPSPFITLFCCSVWSWQLWHLLLMERPFTGGDTPDWESRGRLGGVSDLGGLGGGPIGGSVPAGLGGSMGGLLGSGEHWGSGRPRRLHSQRRYRSRGSSRPDRSPAVEGWVTKHLSFNLLSSHICLIYTFALCPRIVQQFLTSLFANSGVPGSPPFSW